MTCLNAVPVGECCPVCGAVHPDKGKTLRHTVIGFSVLALISGIGLYVYINRRAILYDADYQPIFGWVKDLPASSAFRESGLMSERPPANYGSWWQ